MSDVSVRVCHVRLSVCLSGSVRSVDECRIKKSAVILKGAAYNAKWDERTDGRMNG